MDPFPTYRLRPESFEGEKRRLLRGLYAVYLLALVTALMIGLRNLDFTPGAHFFISLMVITLSTLFTVSIGFWSIFRSLRLRREAWLSLELTLRDDSIIRRMDGHDELVLVRPEITGFDETAGRGFFIKTNNGHKFIFVPAELEGYKDLKQRLSEWRPFPAARSRDPIWRSPFFIGSICLLALGVLWVSGDKRYLLAATFVLVVFLLSTFITVLRSPRSSTIMRRTSWIYLAIAAVALMRLFTVLRVKE